VPQVDSAVKEVGGVVRENVVLRAAQAFASTGYIATYVHNVLGPGCGTMASAVALENDSMDLSQEVPEEVAEMGKHLAMQVSYLCTSRAEYSSWTGLIAPILTNG
jgi:translation elongation factor EF-Ts